MKTLPTNIESIGFVEREKKSGEYIKNRCGRDFLYYALNYYRPLKFNPSTLSPVEMDKKNLFGLRLPAWLMWTQLQFINVSKYLLDNDLSLSINKKKIGSYFSFVKAILLSRISYPEAIGSIEKAVIEGRASGIDISLRFGGLLDHVLFVYGYDNDNLYVCDTHQVNNLEYEKMLEDKYFMKLPKRIIEKRWTKFGRVWEVTKLQCLTG